jgi:hypothetical protein
MAIESGGRAFDNSGRMLLRFEIHIFYEEWGKLNPDRFNEYFRFSQGKIWEGHQWRPSPDQDWRDFHGNLQAEWETFTFARNLAPEAAARSTSMGAPQIMGFNHAHIGYPSAQNMFEAFAGSAHAQIIALFDFVKDDPARLNALRTGDYTAFASSYNGPGQAAIYAALIQEGINTFNRLHEQQKTAASAPQKSEEQVQPVEEPKDSNMDQTSQLPAPGSPGNLAESDPELYAAWRNHVLAGFANNQKMFEQLVNAFMGPYYTTVQLYRLTFGVGMLALAAAAILSAITNQIMFGVLFGGIGVAAFVSYFITRPLRALEENIHFITWLGVIYNSYWTRIVYAMNMETVQQDIAVITNDFTKQIQELLDKSDTLHKNRPGID